MSLLTGQIILRVQHVHPHIPGPVIASALAVLCGAFVFTLGILRLGYGILSFPCFHPLIHPQLHCRFYSRHWYLNRFHSPPSQLSILV
jgi:hypothetical protein